MKKLNKKRNEKNGKNKKGVLKMKTDKDYIIYSIPNWKKKYETTKTRGYRSLSWFSMDNDYSRFDMIELLSRPDGVELYGVFGLLGCLASKCEPRGVFFASNGIPHTVQSMAMQLRVPEDVIKKALNVFSKAPYNWIKAEALDDYLRRQALPSTQKSPNKDCSGTNEGHNCLNNKDEYLGKGKYSDKEKRPSFVRRKPLPPNNDGLGGFKYMVKKMNSLYEENKLKVKIKVNSKNEKLYDDMKWYCRKSETEILSRFCQYIRIYNSGMDFEFPYIESLKDLKENWDEIAKAHEKLKKSP